MKLCRWLSALAVLIGALLLASWSAILTATDHADRGSRRTLGCGV